MKIFLILLLVVAVSSCKRIDTPHVFTDNKGHQFYLKEKCKKGYWRFNGKSSSWFCEIKQTEIIYIR